jgi:hypothetical protein
VRVATHFSFGVRHARPLARSLAQREARDRDREPPEGVERRLLELLRAVRFGDERDVEERPFDFFVALFFERDLLCEGTLSPSLRACDRLLSTLDRWD